MASAKKEQKQVHPLHRRQKFWKFLIILVPLSLGFLMLYESQRMDITPEWKKYVFNAYAVGGSETYGGAVAIDVDADSGLGTLTFQNDFHENSTPLDSVHFQLPKWLEVYNVTASTIQITESATGPEEPAQITATEVPGANYMTYNVEFTTVRPDVVQLVVRFRGSVIPHGEFVVGGRSDAPRGPATSLQIVTSQYACGDTCFDTDSPEAHFEYIDAEKATYWISQDGGAPDKLSAEIVSVDRALDFMKNLYFSLAFLFIAVGAGVMSDESVKKIEKRFEE